MVQFRGINIHVVSQFDAKRLPEHCTARAFDAASTVVACYIPVYTGAQIWLEYSIDGPHPPNATYFFKMLINGQAVTSWDCTAKHEYQGKTVYLLHTVKSNVDAPVSVLQKSMVFGNIRGSQSPKAKNDCIEIRVHRVEHRRRIRDLPLDNPFPKQSRGQETLRLKDHGLIEPYRPARRYQYQLLDSHDDPYATFRLYCRTQEYLERHRLIDVDQSFSSSSLETSTSNYFDTNTSPAREKSVDSMKKEPSTPTKHTIHELGASTGDSATKTRPSSRSPVKNLSPHKEKTLSIKDSIEDLHSPVPRSPQSPKRIVFHTNNHQENATLSPTQPSSPLLPEALKIRKPRSPKTDTKLSALASEPPTPSPEKSPRKSSRHRTLPLRQSSLPSPPSTASPRPARLPYQRHKPTHLNLNLNHHYSPDFKFDDSPKLHLNLNLPSPLASSNSTTTHKVPDNPPSTPTTTHRSLSPFTPSGLLRRFSSASSLPCRRPSTPTPLIPTVQEVDTAVRLHNEKRRSRVGKWSEKINDEENVTLTATPRTLRRMRSAGFLNGLFRKKGERGVVSDSSS